MITHDETKRQTNLAKHGLDLADAALVYDAPNKITLTSMRNEEFRLVYVERDEDIRAISLRRASKAERRMYEAAQQD